MSYYDDVGKFHKKFGLPSVTHGPVRAIIGEIEAETFLYRLQFLHEELYELLVAYRAKDLAGQADALADLVYVALGTAHYLGLPFDAVWDEVQRANMTKVRASGDGDTRSKRGSGLDVVKPGGWTPPNIAGILRDH